MKIKEHRKRIQHTAYLIKQINERLKKEEKHGEKNY